MAITSRRRTRRHRRFLSVSKPSGSIHPRVQQVGPEHSGVVAVDCAKARSKWMLTDPYGKILIAPTSVEHTRHGLAEFAAAIRRAMTEYHLGDLVVAIERTGSYHAPVKRAAIAAGLEARIVHPLASKQFRLPADPGNRTDDTDLFAITWAAVNGFGLVEPTLDEAYLRLRLLARHRRDLVRKNAGLRIQIHAELDARLPGLAAAVGDIFDHEPALIIARHLGSPAEILARGIDGLAALPRAERVRHHRRSLTEILAWAERAPEPSECPDVHKRIFACLDDERRSRPRTIRDLEVELAGSLVQTPYVLQLSFPGINVVSAAEFTAEMGPIANSPGDAAVTGRAGIFPSRYRSDSVDHAGPLVRRGDRALRYVTLLITENLLRCNDHFRELGEAWGRGGANRRIVVTRAAKRFCRIAYRMVAGGDAYRHPSCRERHHIPTKLSVFSLEHETSLEQVSRELRAAVDWIPQSERAAEARSLGEGPPSGAPAGASATAPPDRAARPRDSNGRRSGPRPLSAIPPEVLLRLGVRMIESNP